MTSRLLPRLAPAPAPRPSLLRRLTGLAAIARSRRALARLTSEQLADVGLTADQARRESGRALWDAPERWLR